VSTRIPLLEIWTNDDANEFAVRLSGQPDPVLRTSPYAEYTRIIFAAPYEADNLASLASLVEVLIMDGKRR